MIRDELLGNDSLEQDSEHESVSSSNDSGVELDPSSQEESTDMMTKSWRLDSTPLVLRIHYVTLLWLLTRR